MEKSEGTAMAFTALGFFGLAGVQHFYLDRPIKGVIWLITLGLFGIGTIFDLITMGNQVKASNYKAQKYQEMLKTKYKRKK